VISADDEIVAVFVTSTESMITGARRGERLYKHPRANVQRSSSNSTSLVSDRGARWAGKVDHFEALEADFAAPFLEIRGGIIERVAEFDQHV